MLLLDSRCKSPQLDTALCQHSLLAQPVTFCSSGTIYTSSSGTCFECMREDVTNGNHLTCLEFSADD
ncbi:hypothetical protein RRG08_032306 [Elysia crispata]|uniref:Uncharacterized protein n=1 Tax=Elysia crispata TaxID=231223 RepID=A0AAE1ARJ0_9GAST|nr:hypothetical protein RRG08_032306 [Elysia crispata]